MPIEPLLHANRASLADAVFLRDIIKSVVSLSDAVLKPCESVHAPSLVDNLVDTYKEFVSMYKGACTGSAVLQPASKNKRVRFKE